MWWSDLFWRSLQTLYNYFWLATIVDPTTVVWLLRRWWWWWEVVWWLGLDSGLRAEGIPPLLLVSDELEQLDSDPRLPRITVLAVFPAIVCEYRSLAFHFQVLKVFAGLKVRAQHVQQVFTNLISTLSTIKYLHWRYCHLMPFDKKLACLTNYKERRSFPWPLVTYISAKR